MKRIRRAGWTFFTTLKSNRLVSLANFTQTKEGFVRLFAQSPDITRTLVPGSLEVYPVKNYGAMHIATQRFCHVENGRDDYGNSKFVMVWQQQTGTWRITRVVSYDH